MLHAIVTELTVTRGQLIMLLYAAVLFIWAVRLAWSANDLWTLGRRGSTVACAAAAVAMLGGAVMFTAEYFGQELLPLQTRRLFFLAYTLALFILWDGVDRHFVNPAAAAKRKHDGRRRPED